MKPKRTVLLTGFEPFGGEHVNPSQQIVSALDGEHIHGYRIVSRVLPVAFAPCICLLKEWIEELQPTLVIGIGQAGGRAELSLERVAINLMDARIPDNDGAQPVDVPVDPDAPDGLFASLPLKRVLYALRDAGIPVAMSHTAGTYVCNQVFFLTVAHLARSANGARGGFIHVPWLPEQATCHPGQPSMALETMVAGVRLAIRTCLAHDDDIELAAGSTH
ncbi:MAG: pyroglutamyl-peptidase I [Dokdonella sp.]